MMKISLDNKLLRGFWGDIIALIAGVCVPFAFAPYNLIFLAILSPAVYIWTWMACSPKRAFWRGYIYGLGCFGVGISWVAVSMIRFGHMSVGLSAALTMLFVAGWAFSPAIVSYLAQRFFPQLSLELKLLLVIPGLWTMVEWVRSWIFTGYPWLSLGYSQVDGPLYGVAPLLGIYGISWLLMLVVGCVLLIVCTDKPLHRYGYVGLILLVTVSGSLLGQVEWTQANGKTIKVTLIQGNIPQELKWSPSHRQSSIDLYTNLSRENWDSDLIIWPETAFPSYYHRARHYLEKLGEEARQHNTDMLIGIPMVDEKDNSLHYNSIISIGRKADYYHKRHLVPFGEYLPMKYLLGDLLDFFKVPMASFSSGSKDRMILEVAGTKAGISICYEDAFGVEVIQSLPEAELLVNVSNDAWFGDSFAPHQHLQMARMRALESGRPMLRSTNNGVSATIDHWGGISKQSPQFELSVLTDTVYPRSGLTPYAVLGNWPIIVIFLLSLCIGALVPRRRAMRHAG